jgi:COP9 signalosome complex subunit 6
MADTVSNPLISAIRASDTSPIIQLHPLVLLTISDYITRHNLRRQNGPIAGAILGQQNGRELTMEVAFEIKLKVNDQGDYIPEEPWFGERLEQYKTVHKVPPLDLVGWFTLGGKEGPNPAILPLQEHLMVGYNETAVLLLFQPDVVRDDPKELSSGKLPLTIYESVWEQGSGGEKGAMDIDSGAGAGAEGKQMKFRELSYSVETGEAEMISVDFVARGGGNATAIATSSDTSKSSQQTSVSSASTKEKQKLGKLSLKGKEKEKEKSDPDAAADTTTDRTIDFTPEDEELLSSLTAKTNAVRMLHTRITLLQSYLSSLEPSYLTDISLPLTNTTSNIVKNSSTRPTSTSTTGQKLPLSLPILRQLLSLLQRLPILAPPDSATFHLEASETRSDVALISLLSSLTSSVASTKELGRKFGVVEMARHTAAMRKGGMTSFGAGGMGGAGSVAIPGGEGGFFDTVMGERGGLREQKWDWANLKR